MRKNNSHAPLFPETESSGRKRKKTYIFHTRFKVIVAALTVLVVIFGVIACHSLKGSEGPSNDAGHGISSDTSVDEQQPSDDDASSGADTGAGGATEEDSSGSSKTR